MEKNFALKTIHKISENDRKLLIWQYKVDEVGKTFEMKAYFPNITRNETAKPKDCWDWTKKMERYKSGQSL